MPWYFLNDDSVLNLLILHLIWLKTCKKKTWKLDDPNQKTNQTTNQQTNQPIDQPTNIASYRVASTQPKMTQFRCNRPTDEPTDWPTNPNPCPVLTLTLTFQREFRSLWLPFFFLVFIHKRQILIQTLSPVLTHFFWILKKFNGIYLPSILLYDQL